MKYIYFFIVLLTTNLISAQDPRLFGDDTWYLTKIVENSTDYFPPNGEVVPLTFNQQNSSLSTTVCNGMGGVVTFENNYTNFSSSSFVATLIICDFPIPSTTSFESDYFSFFSWNTNFSYNITDNGTVKTLTIVNLSNNKQAIYSSQSLSRTDFEALDFSFYSDSSTDTLNIELKNQNAENTKVEIFDSLGKICKSKYFNSSQIKMITEGLSAGVYIIKITAGNEVGVRKIIKS